MNMIAVTDLNQPELDMYTRRNETQLLHYYEPQEGVFIAESPNVIGRALNAGYEPISFLVEEKELKGATNQLLLRCPQTPVYVAKSEVFTRLTGFQMTRGALCAMRRRPLPDPLKLCKNARRIAILEHVVNPTNIGAIFRSAAALWVDAVLLTPGCCDPLYRRSARVSMGTVFQIPWTYLKEEDMAWPETALKKLHAFGFSSVAMALKADSVPIDDPALSSKDKLAIILGTEGEGLASETIKACDYTALIPMSHQVDSLNVAAASAVAFWQLCRRNI